MGRSRFSFSFSRSRFSTTQTMKSGVLGWGYWGVGSLPVVCLAPLAQYVAYLWGFELGSVVFCGGVCLGVVYSLVFLRVLRPLLP